MKTVLSLLIALLVISSFSISLAGDKVAPDKEYPNFMIPIERPKDAGGNLLFKGFPLCKEAPSSNYAKVLSALMIDGLIDTTCTKEDLDWIIPDEDLYIANVQDKDLDYDDLVLTSNCWAPFSKVHHKNDYDLEL